MTSPSSFNVSGLLGGAAGSIDVTSLISQLMQAAALPQTHLKDQLSTQQQTENAYQALASRLSTLQSAANAFVDTTTATAWTAKAATSSTSSVVATSTSTALTGTTTFDVLALAKAQVTTVTADSSGNVVTDPTLGITITGADGVAKNVPLTTGSAADVATAINGANLGVRASVVTTTDGTQVLQMTSTSTGYANRFTAAGFSSTAQNVVTAQDAQIGVAAGQPGGYTVNSATNTFTNVISGVTFSVSALATGVSVTVADDEKAISDKVSALVDAFNAANSDMTSATGKGAILQGASDVQFIQGALLSTVSKGTATGGSLKAYGIDMDKDGKLSFDATAFASAYGSNPSGTKTDINDFATALAGLATSAIDPVTGSFTQAVDSAKTSETRLSKQIDDWTTRLSDIQVQLQQKYTAMQTALAKLQSQQTYLTSVFKSSSSSSSSSSN